MVESIKKEEIEILAPSSYTERGYSSVLAVSNNKKNLAYCVGNQIVIRNLETLYDARLFIEHSVKTSCVSFSPSNVFVASGDINGNVKVWFLDDFKIKKEYNSCIGGKVNGIAWTEDNTKLLIYGNGKQVMARTIMWDSGNNVGEISGHTSLILSGDIRQVRPYKLVTCGEDYQVNYYEGPPFKLKKINKLHNNYATSVKFSPDGDHFVSVGYDKKIVLYDFKESNGEVIADEKKEGSHKSAICCVHWMNNKEFLTCSLDKTVKVWDLASRSVSKTLQPVSKADVGDIQCAVTSNDTYIISLSLNGRLNFWRIDSLTDNKEPDVILNGHQNYVSRVIYNKDNNTMISADVNGKILEWDVNKNAKLFHNLHVTKVISLALSIDNKVLYSLGADLNLIGYDLIGNTKLFETKLKSGEPQSLQSSRTNPEIVYALCHNGVYLINNGKIETEHNFSFEARSLAVSESEYYIGDRDGYLHILDYSFKLVKKIHHHLAEISCLKLSNNGRFLASGDNTKFIKVINTATKELYTDDFEHHKAKVYDISWSSNDEKLTSCSLDRNVILWDVATKKKVKIYPDLDNEVVLTVAFFENSAIYCGGHSCSLYRINL